eukprot:scaffold71475_cov67-Phaeocystis_antarctica.AAC.8
MGAPRGCMWASPAGLPTRGVVAWTRRCRLGARGLQAGIRREGRGDLLLGLLAARLQLVAQAAAQLVALRRNVEHVRARKHKVARHHGPAGPAAEDDGVGEHDERHRQRDVLGAVLRRVVHGREAQEPVAAGADEAEELCLVRGAVRHLVRELSGDGAADDGLGGAEGEGGEAEADERDLSWRDVGGRLRRRSVGWCDDGVRRRVRGPPQLLPCVCGACVVRVRCV